MRLDKWLWFARVFKSRSLAQGAVEARLVRLDGRVVAKPAQPVAPGDELEFPAGRRRVRVVALAGRRGPASEARALYEELEPPLAEEGD